MNNIYPLTVFFDGDCPICSAEMRNLQLRDERQQLRFVDVATSTQYPAGTDRAALMTLIHAQRADGSVVSGMEVFRLVYSAIGIPWVARLTSLPGLKSLSEALYPWIARNRYRMPRVLVSMFELAMRRAARASAARARCGTDCRVDSKVQS